MFNKYCYNILSPFLIIIDLLILKPAKCRVVDEASNLNIRKCDSMLSVMGYLAPLEAVINESLEMLEC